MDDIATTYKRKSKLTSRRLAAIGAIGVGVALLAAAIAYLFQDWGGAAPALVYYQTTQADLPIVVTERGYLESQEQTTIRCQVESYDRNSGSSGLTILSIVPNGSLVQAGDLLVELDSAAIRDRLDSETLEFESDKSARDQARARKLNQVTQNETRLEEAKLALELAKLDKLMYLDEESGAFKLALEEIERQIDDTRNSMLEAQAALKLQETEKAGIEELFKLGYKGKSDLDQSRFAFMKAEATLAASVNRLSNHEASRRQLETYEYRKELLRLDGAVATAERNLEQVKVTNESELAQVNSQLFEAEERVSRQQSNIDQLQRQLGHCTIKAPHAGMVVYAKDESSSGYGLSRIGEGAIVRSRQELLTLPDLSQMQVRTQVHEAVLDQIKQGLPVTVHIDAFPDRTYTGIVSEVAVVPSMTSNSSVKTYDCVIVIPDTVQQLKPGMTAVSEIHIERLRQVVSVPVQAIVQVDGATWCYVESAGGVARRDVVLGRNNDKFVHIAAGVSSGERVVLNPGALYEREPRSTNEIAPDTGISEAPVLAGDENLNTDTPTSSQGVEAIDEEGAPAATGRRRGPGGRGGRRNATPADGDDGPDSDDARDARSATGATE